MAGKASEKTKKIGANKQLKMLRKKLRRPRAENNPYRLEILTNHEATVKAGQPRFAETTPARAARRIAEARAAHARSLTRGPQEAQEAQEAHTTVSRALAGGGADASRLRNAAGLRE